MVSPQEKELLESIKRGDPSAIKILFEKYHSSLCQIAFRFTRNHDLAKDIVQDVFIKFWNNRGAIEITSSLSAYLRRSVINTSLNQIEKDKPYSKIDLAKLPHHPLAAPTDQSHSLDELSVQVENAINKLPVRTRAVFLLIRREEMSYKEVGQVLNISLKAVEKEMIKALRLLREMLKNVIPILLIVPFC